MDADSTQLCVVTPGIGDDRGLLRLDRVLDERGQHAVLASQRGGSSASGTPHALPIARPYGAEGRSRRQHELPLPASQRAAELEKRGGRKAAHRDHPDRVDLYAHGSRGADRRQRLV